MEFVNFTSSFKHKYIMRHIILTTALSLAIVCPALGQVVKQYAGTVVDEGGKPFQYVTVQLLNAADSSVISSAATDESGAFTLQGTTNKELAKFTFIGYETIIKAVSAGNVGVTAMKPDFQALGEVVVNGEKPVVKSTVDGLQYIVANDEFAKGLNGEELMSRVPVLEVKPSPTGMDVSVVGKGSTHFLLNGKTLPDNILQSKLKSLRSEDIERVEVMTIPPAKYAAEGNAGYVNIVTKKDDVYGFKGNLTGFAGVDDHLMYNVVPTINYVSPKVEASLGASYLHVDQANERETTYTFADHDRADNWRNDFKWNWYTVNGLVKYYPTKRIEVGGTVGINIEDVTSLETDMVNDNSVITTSRMRPLTNPNFQLSAEAYLDWKIDSLGKDLQLTYDYTHNYERDKDTLRSISNDMPLDIMTTGSNRYRIDSYKADLTLPYDKLKLTAGLAYSRLSNDSWSDQYNGMGDAWAMDESLSNSFLYHEHTAAAYATAGYQFGENVFANVGLRLERTWLDGIVRSTSERHTDNYTHLFPTVHLLWNTPKGANLSLEYSMGINRPAFYDLNPFRYYNSSMNYYAGNPYLVPSTTHNFGLNFNYKGLYAVLYENHVGNGINTTVTFDDNGARVNKPENYVTSDKVGLYASYNKDIFSWWNIIIGGDFFYSAARAKASVADIPSVHGWSVKLEANSTWFLDNAHKLAFNVHYSHAFPCYNGVAKYDTSVIFSGGLRYSLLGDRLNLSCDFHDPFNQMFTRRTVTYATYTMEDTYDAHSRSVRLTATWNFGGKKVKQVYHESKNTESGRVGIGH